MQQLAASSCDLWSQRRLLSMQLTGAWMSEAIEMDVGLVDALAGRLGRYPSAQLGVQRGSQASFTSVG
jgi:hypothetical protein